jgi:transposase
VNNFAVPMKKSGEQILPTGYPKPGGIAPDRTRSFASHLAKVSQSLPACPAAPVLKSEKMTAREAPGIRSTLDGAAVPRTKGKTMQNWSDYAHFIGFDWAREKHAVVLVDRTGKIVLEFDFPHTLEGWQSFRQKTQAFAPLAVAIETNQGIVVDQLLQGDYPVYPVNPVAAESYRKRKMPSGTKTDFFDAWGLADGLRVDGQNWKQLTPTDERTQEIRLLCKDEVALIQQRTLLVNQLQQALVEYFPAALEAFDDWTMPAAWEFIVVFSTPEALVKAGRRRWEKFLHSHRLWRPQTADKRLEIFARADQFQGTPALVKAKSQLAVSLCRVLRTLQQQLNEYRQRITECFHQHPDHELFGSLPGAKEVLAPRLLAAIGVNPDRYDRRHEVLQAFAGTAPISFTSGQFEIAKIRWACDAFLRHTMHLWADCFRHASAWGEAYYQKKRADGLSHACALRCLGQRLLKIVMRMLIDKKPYDAELHARNQKKHGSWVIALLDPTAKEANR